MCASRSLCAIADDRTAMELFSTARSTSPPIQRCIIGRGRARSRCSGCLVVVVLSLFALLGRWVASALPDPAPVSAPVLAARRSVGGLSRACGARHVQARLSGGGGGCGGARHGGRLFAGAPTAANPRHQGAVSRPCSGRWVGAVEVGYRGRCWVCWALSRKFGSKPRAE